MKKKITDVEKLIYEDMSGVNVPESLSPDNIKNILNKSKRKKTKMFMTTFATAACLVIIAGLGIYQNSLQKKDITISDKKTLLTVTEDAQSVSDNDKELYDKLYARVSSAFEENRGNNSYWGGDLAYDVMEDDSESMEASTNTTTVSGSLVKIESYSSDFAGTNVQVEAVDEGDIVKNDGRYLYQIILENYRTTSIQIVDTDGGLKEIAVIDAFEEISEFYVHEDTLVVIEKLWTDTDTDTDTYEYFTKFSKILSLDDTIYTSTINEFTRIHFYDISNRENPKVIKVYNIKGHYESSRISDNYFYIISKYYTEFPMNQEDFDAYLPVIDGEPLNADKIYLPEDSDAYDYMMISSINLEDPSEFVENYAIVCNGNQYYVSEDYIYVLDSWAGKRDIKEGKNTSFSNIIKISYDKGIFETVAETQVKGTVSDQFAMNEYNGYFRVITCVDTFEVEEIIDDISGESLGYAYKGAFGETNSVYVLDENLSLVGSIEGLAEDERVYSARFMGDIGYFVTFRETDPLFTVDFSDPTNPHIIGELKISGFSDYLHFYGDNLLLGIGYEADEDTGATNGVKISMFDISDPTDVREINKLVFDEYYYSTACYTHHAVLVNVDKNVIGFTASGYGSKNGEYKNCVDYKCFSYNDGFKERFTINCNDNLNSYYIRGTYIGETFYLLGEDGNVSAYNLESGEFIESLK